MVQRARRLPWVCFLAVLLVVYGVVALPTFYIQPFRPQGERGMALAYAFRSAAPLATAVGLGLLLLFGAWLCAGARWRVRTVVIVLVALALPPAWFVRQNHFEWMFNPVEAAEYAAVDEAAFLTDTEIVMGVQTEGHARAFPIRQLAYHHLVNTEVGDVPIVATY